MTRRQSQIVGALYRQIVPKWYGEEYPKYWRVTSSGQVAPATPIQLIASKGYGRLNPRPLGGIAGTQERYNADRLLGSKVRRIA